MSHAALPKTPLNPAGQLNKFPHSYCMHLLDQCEQILQQHGER